MYLLNPANVKYIILHCSASEYGAVALFDSWHKAKGWNSIGYHWIITNCYPLHTNWTQKKPNLAFDGSLFQGRPEKFCGAHVRGYNWQSLGVCLVGNKSFTGRQLKTTIALCRELKSRYPNIEAVKGHYEFTHKKTCPNFDMNYFRDCLLPSDDLNLDDLEGLE